MPDDAFLTALVAERERTAALRDRLIDEHRAVIDAALDALPPSLRGSMRLWAATDDTLMIDLVYGEARLRFMIYSDHIYDGPTGYTPEKWAHWAAIKLARSIAESDTRSYLRL